jgi:hypothetical protein
MAAPPGEGTITTPGTGSRWAAALRRPSLPIVVAGLVILGVLLRLPFLGLFPMPDESGLLIVASHWRDGGPMMYGHLFVDRPPGLLAFYALVNTLGGITAARWLGMVLVAVLVVAASRLGWLLGGRRGAVWAGIVAMALATNRATGSQEINAELIGVPFIVAGIALGLDAVRREHTPTRQWLLLVSAGLLVSVGPAVKQNLVDGVVFLVGFVAAQAWCGRWAMRRTLTTLVALAAGVAVLPVVVAIWFVVDGPGLAVVWHTLFGFRVQAGQVISDGSLVAVGERMRTLPLLALSSGLVTLLLAGAWLLRRRLAHPVVLATGVALVVELVGVGLGGSYWAHYLIALVPGVVLVVSATAAVAGRGLPMVLAVTFALTSTVVDTAVAVVGPPATAQDLRDRAVTSWLEDAHLPGDTGLVTYGQAQVLEASGLRPGYPFLWSLPARTLDPDLHRMARDLHRPAGPDWVVVWLPVDTWGLDPYGLVAGELTRHYRQVATVCGVPIWLKNGEYRTLPSVPAGCTVTP